MLVAYSGGADSAFLLAAAVRALGADQVVAATGYSHSLPRVRARPGARVRRVARGRACSRRETHEMEREGYRANAGDRCFFCKAELLDVLTPLAAERGLAHVATGTNADDAVAGFRPGIRAAAERGAITPLRDAGLTKAQVRAASRRWGLPTWDKPAAACLSSRVAYGVEVTPYRLARVERAEAAVARAARRRPGSRCATCGCATWATGPRSRSTPPCSPTHLAPGTAARATRAGRRRRPASTPPTSTRRGFRSGSMNEALVEP